MLPMLRTKPMFFAVQSWAAKKAGATGPKAACMPDRKKFSQARASRLRRDDVTDGNLATLICKPASAIVWTRFDVQLMNGCRCRCHAPRHDRCDSSHPSGRGTGNTNVVMRRRTTQFETRHFETSAY